MELYVKPGKYIVAVSGGVDSVALLDIVSRLPGLDLIVAHFEHGIRADSDEDRQLVEELAVRYGLPFIFARGGLGEGASEAVAREARYAFLRAVKDEQKADSIITAHHEDDLVETALINLLRGTGSRGLSALRSTPELYRPLLGVTKQELMDYATEHKLVWHEDSTNSDERYMRNYVRRKIIPKMSAEQRADLLNRIQSAGKLHVAIDHELQPYTQSTELERRWFLQLPHSVAAEALAMWLRNHGASFDRRTIERLVVFAKTALPGKRADVDFAYYVLTSKNHITLHPR